MIINLPNTMILFRDDDEAYTEFLEDPDNFAGFVLNTTRTPSRSFAALHRADCSTIQGAPTRGKQWTTGDYCKIWAAHYEELEHWVSRKLHATAKPCGRCRPEALAASLKGDDELHTDTYSQPVEASERQTVLGLQNIGFDPSGFGYITPVDIDRILLKRRITGKGWTYWAEGWVTEVVGKGGSEKASEDIKKWTTVESRIAVKVLPFYWPFFAPTDGNRHCMEWSREIFRDFIRELNEKEKALYDSRPSLELMWTVLFGPVDYHSFEPILTDKAGPDSAQANQLIKLGMHSIPALQAIRGILENDELDCKKVASQIDAMLFSRDWRAHLVAAAAIALGAASDELLLCLWRALDAGSQAMPQLAATAAYLDPEFDISVFSRLVNELASPHGRSATGMAAMLALFRLSPSAGSREEAADFATDADMQAILAQEQEGGGMAALVWLEGLRELIGERKSE